MYVKFRRDCERRVPFAVFADANNDWTHFKHLHRRSHAEFRLLYKSGRRQIFLYKTRLLYPLPFARSYIVFREELPGQAGYRNVYLDPRSGRVNVLDARTVDNGATCSGIGDFWFWLGRPWRWCPALFARLFRRRMRKVAAEDDALMRERLRLGAFSDARCAPELPESYDLYEDVLKDGPPRAEREFVDHGFEDLTPPKGPRP